VGSSEAQLKLNVETFVELWDKLHSVPATWRYQLQVLVAPLV
tara:strand:- start:482 stop:607 length:126 start_codon:yes stop_codon:yes gene_type:complete